MKRIAFLFLFVSLFYNALGYYLMFAQQDEQAWVFTIENTPDSELKVIELNASLYSFVPDTEFEYVNENVVIDNKSYHIFKKRIQDNILSLYYLPNLYGDVIGKDLNDIVDNQLFNSPATKGTPVKKLLKTFLQDFIPSYSSKIVIETDSAQYSKTTITLHKQDIHSGYLRRYITPPEIV
jgi:hypothetical protein